MCNVQKVIVGEKDITSIANFANWGGGVPHMSFTLPMRGWGWQAVLACTYIHI